MLYLYDLRLFGEKVASAKAWWIEPRLLFLISCVRGDELCVIVGLSEGLKVYAIKVLCVIESLCVVKGLCGFTGVCAIEVMCAIEGLCEIEGVCI